MSISIKVKKVTNSKIKDVDINNAVFGKTFTDHMFVAQYRNGQWGDCEIKPFENLSISPANTTLHYATTIFEGLKAHRSKNGDILVFRPQSNAERFQTSAKRICMPELPQEIFLEGIKALIKIDADWVPDKKGTSLYIRPFQLAMDNYIGIRPSDTFSFYIIASPVSAYYSEPLKVKIERHYTRAVKGGTGFAKTGGNYAASLFPAKEEANKGYQQLIWTDGLTHEYIEEAGTMNLFFVINNQILTAPTGDSVLNGVTRNSIIQLAKEEGFDIDVRKISVTEIIEAFKKGQIQDAFGAGTAATIAHLKTIGIDGVDYDLPPVSERKYSNFFLDKLTKIKLGEIEDTHGWIMKI